MWQTLLVVALFALAAVVAALLEPLPPELSGRMTVADGDTMRLGADRIRLTGLDAPELDQTCLDGRGAPWPCGRASSERLRALVGGREVHCATEGKDRHGRYLARCSVDRDDIGGILVAEGLAVADLPSYAREDAAARGDRKGIWQGRFDSPRQWRDTHGDTGAGFDLFAWIRSWFA